MLNLKLASIQQLIIIILLQCISIALARPPGTGSEPADSSSAPTNQAAGGAPIWLMSSLRLTGGRPSDNEKLNELLQRAGPNLVASTDYHDFTDIKLNESIESWRWLHEESKLYAQNQVQFYKPRIGQLLRDANASLACQNSVQSVMSSMEQLDSWSVQMWSSTGNFPTVGLFDGQFTDLGSYRGCLDIKIPPPTPDTNSHNSSVVSHTSYCMVPFRPVVPSRTPFRMIYKQHPALVSLFNESDAFNKLAQKAQYFHYVYWKTGLCVPYQCSPSDLQQVAKLIGQRLALMTGPVKCYTRNLTPTTRTTPSEAQRREGKAPAGSGNGVINQTNWAQRHFEPILIRIDEPMSGKQMIAALIICSFFGLVLLATLMHAIEICHRKALRWRIQRAKSSGRGHLDGDDDNDDESKDTGKVEQQQQQPLYYNGGLKYVAYQYFSVITNTREFLDTSMRSNEIKCLHGLRVFTMIWIIVVHTLQYNDWSGFTRVFENEATLKDPMLQPIYNANYVVDNFFFMSGLLAAYTIWYANKGSVYNFSILASLIGRYLRLTPQVLLISLLYIILPLAGNGPFWYDMSAQAAQDCQRNWWVNLFHVQAFYREDEMCNLVGWWISVDMFYYVLSLGLVFMILKQQPQRALGCTMLFVISCMAITAYRHYIGGYTPNNLAAVPQVGEVWSSYVVYFFWSPFPHAYPFFLGLWSGYVLANNKWRKQVREWSRFGWTVATASLVLVNLSSHIWMSGKVELGDQYISTAYNIICTIIWSTGFGWIVIACHYGCATTFNKLLSIELFVLLSKASFIIYLSHMLVVRLYFGLQNALLEVCLFTLTYVILGNIIVSITFGVFLCIAFEGPCLKFQKVAVQWVKRQLAAKSSCISTTGANTAGYANNLDTFKDCKVTLGGIDLGPTGNALLK